jgi:hypothetical protein
MVLEAVAAALVGLAGLFLVIHPLLRRQRSNSPPATEPLDPEETPRGVALAALKEIDFDRETGKLSDADYQFLKAKYTAIALDALRAEQESSEQDPLEAIIAARSRTRAGTDGRGQPTCRICGPRPEADAVFCSTCGLRLRPLGSGVGSRESRVASHESASRPIANQK